ncbi:MAG TPA: hybrid sensor histidine kinase/response regulator, partial [Acidobacteria bacterium]|nr:hybrid sensor histidine kinase/response regulator [Acidobacteriota bacterium]
ELFRAAHSLKGAAAMVEMGEVQRLAHAMEDLFGAIREGRLEPGEDVIDLLLAGTDGLRTALAAEPGDGAVAGRVDRLVAALSAAAEGGAVSQPGKPGGQDRTKAGEPPPAPPAAETGAAAPEAEAGRVQEAARRVSPAETHIHVPSAAVDELVERLAEVGIGARGFDQLPVRIAAVERRVRGLAERLAALGREGSRDASREFESLAGLREAVGELRDELATWALEARRQVEEQARLVAEARDAAQDLRMLPMSTLLQRFPRVVRDTARRCGKRVELVTSGGDVRLDREVLERLADPLAHLLRNAIDHGIEEPAARREAGKPETGRVEIVARQRGRLVEVEVRDDGRGIDVEALQARALAAGLIEQDGVGNRSREDLLRLAFSTGLSTARRVTELSGRGVGLDVVRANLETLQGRVEVRSEPGRGTVFTLTVPLSLATSFAVLVSCGGTVLAFPAGTVDRVLRVALEELATVDGWPVVRIGGHPVPVADLGAVLRLGEVAQEPGPRPVVVAGVVEHRMAFVVEKVEDSRELVISELGPQARNIPVVAGGALLPDGRPVIVLDVGAVIDACIARGKGAAVSGRTRRRRRRILLADDSLTTRALEKTILEGAGYDVVAVPGGEEAWNELRSGEFDAVVSDIEMPGLDGFGLTRKIRSDPVRRDLPVVLVTSLESQADRQRGLEAGADAYIVKRTFDQRELLETLERLIAEEEPR